MKKFISILSVIILFFGATIPFGNNAKADSLNNQNEYNVSGVEVKILEDNENQKIVETTLNGEKTISTFNKLTSNLNVVQNGVKVLSEFVGNGSEVDGNGSDIYNSTLNGAVGIDAVVHPTNPAIRKTIYSLSDTIFNSTCKVVRVSYKNDDTTFKLWTVGYDKNNVTTVRETSKNSSDLQTFKGSVKDIVLYEDDFAAAGGTAYFAIVAGTAGATASLGVAAIIGALTAAGAGITLINDGVKVYQTHQDQKLYYDTIIH